MSKISKHIDTWSVYNAFALTFTLLLVLVSKQLNVLLLIFSISLVALIYINKKELFRSKPFFGIANTITLLRYVIIVLSFLLLDLDDTNYLFFSLGIAVILDFFDGRAARYFKESSFFGQYFDMEIDAFFVLLMCSFYYLYQGVSWWILLPGLLRYLFRICTFCFPKPEYKEEKKTYATIIAASYFIVLLMGLITSGVLQFLILLIGSLALVVSFLIGFIQYYRQ